MLTVLSYSFLGEWYIKFIWLTDYNLLKPSIYIEYSLLMFLMSCLRFFFMLPICLQQVPPVREIRKLMRIQALRCHVIYCQNGRKINVIPVLASRAQALRYHSYNSLNFLWH